MNKIFRRFYIALLAFSPNRDLMSPKLRKRDQQIKTLTADFQFFKISFVATLFDWYQDWFKVALACLQTRWNEVKGTRRAKFGAKSGASARKENFASKGPPSPAVQKSF